MIVGTGASVRMEIPVPTTRDLQKHSRALIENDTYKATQIFTEEIAKKRKLWVHVISPANPTFA